MNRVVKSVAAGAVAAGLVFAASPAMAAQNSTQYGSRVCVSGYRAAIYLAAVGDMGLYLNAGNSGTTDYWYNATRTTRVKLSPVFVPFMDYGVGFYYNTSSNKGSDCRFI